MQRFAILGLIAAMGIFIRGSVPQADDESPTAVVKPPSMTLVGAAVVVYGDQRHISVTVQVSNPNDASLLYTGYTPDSFDPPLEIGSISPMFEIEVLRNGEWHAHPMGWCGTGLAELELPPDTPVIFAVAVPDDSWEAIKVGFGHQPGWSDSGQTTATTWSTVVTREEIDGQL